MNNMAIQGRSLPAGITLAAATIFERVPCLTYCHNCREPLSATFLNSLLLDPYYERLVKALGDDFCCDDCCKEAKAYGNWLDHLGEDIF